MSTKANSRWYDEVREITERLVRINSISPSVAGENACAAAITRALEEQGLTPGYWKTSGDERKNVWTMLEGGAVPPAAIKIPTVILIGHHDVAGVQDFFPAEDPFDPQALQEALFEQFEKNPDTEDELLLDAGNLIQETNLNVDLCDEADGEITVPSVTQKQRDFKARYDFDLIHELDCDVANVGPWGKEAHGKGERVYMPYSFETVPELIHNVVLGVLRDAESET